MTNNIVLFPDPNWDDFDQVIYIEYQQGFLDACIDERGELYFQRNEKGEKEAYDFWIQRGKQDQEEDRAYAKQLGMTLVEYYLEQDKEEAHRLGMTLEEYYNGGEAESDKRLFVINFLNSVLNSLEDFLLKAPFLKKRKGADQCA